MYARTEDEEETHQDVQMAMEIYQMLLSTYVCLCVCVKFFR